MNKTTIIIAMVFIILIILLYILTIIIKSKRKKDILSNVDRLTTEKNLIMSSALITELSKASKLTNNKKIEEEVEDWKERLDKIEKEDMPKLTDELVEIESLCMNKDYEGANEKIGTVEKHIFHVKAKSIKLLSEIKDLTESEERNREAITKLKSLYREVIFKYNKNKDDYKEVSSPIELQFENIDKLFSAFEVSIQNHEYEELGKIVKALDDMIHNISIVIEEAPTIVLIATMILPKKMKDIKSIATRMTRDGYNIEYLNIDYNIEETNKKISEIMDRLNVLNLQDSVFDLKTLVDYYEAIYSDFDNEKRSKKEYERGIININDRIVKVSSVLRNLYAEIDNLKDTYDLSDEEIMVIDEINKELVDNPYFHRVYANKDDKVLCIDDGGSYTTYDEFFKDNGYRYCLSNYKHAALTPGMIYTVVAVYPHRDYSCNVYILKNDNEDVFLCTDDIDYLYKIQPNAKPWTEKAKDRFRKIQANNSVFGLSFHCVPGGHLFVRSFLTSESLFMSNATRRSSKAIQGTLNKFIKDNILV